MGAGRSTHEVIGTARPKPAKTEMRSRAIPETNSGRRASASRRPVSSWARPPHPRLAAITLDGIPENLALGVALIGAGPLQVASLSGSIFLSNLPEAAEGAQEMANGRSKLKVLGQ